MRIPIVFPVVIGASEKVERTGGSFHGVCPTCKQPERFYQAKKRFNVSAFGGLSLWDSDEPVVQCGTCEACFKPGDIEEIAAPSLLGRIGNAFRAKAAPVEAQSAPAAATKSKAAADDDIDAELAALKKRIGK